MVSAGVAITEQVVSFWPRLPEPAHFVLVCTAVAGFLTGISSAFLSSLIAVAYALIFVPERHPNHHSGFEVCWEGIFLAASAPLLALMGGKIRQIADRASDTLKKHLSNTPLGVIELGEDYEISLWAGSSEVIFGIGPEEAIGKSLFELPHIFFQNEDSARLQELLSELEQGIQTKAVHHARIEAKDGLPGHSRWFWSTTLSSRGGRSRFLVLVEDITDRVRAEQELEASRTELIQRLIRAAELRDPDTGSHILRMARYCEALAKSIGMNEPDRQMLYAAAPMHDVGKLGVPDHILQKSGPLDAGERSLMEQHTLVGADILSGSQSELIQMASEIALTHHERWDGSGYPRGLKGEEIPLVGRICAICDVFDALTSDRPYKRAWSVEAAFEEVARLSGTHFDPRLVMAFLSIRSEVEEIRNETECALPQGIRKAA
jgi:PAS domain S-box-containing protein